MRNQEIAKIFNDMARFLRMERVAFKPYAYERAAMSLESLSEYVGDIYKKGGVKALMEIPGVGKAIADHIEEYLKTGRIKHYEAQKKKLPIDLDGLVRVEGMGARKAKVLYQKLGVKNLKDLEKAAKAHKIAPLFGFGEKTEKNILQGLEFLKRDKGRFLLGKILPAARNVVEKLKNLKEVEKISLAGSVRRRKETIGDVDILAVSENPKKVMDFFVKLDGVEKVWAKGPTKSSVRIKEGFDIDIRIVPQKSYGSALQYFTGNKDHNVATRRIAINKGLKLSEYGVFRDKKQIAGKTEEDVYKAIGLPYIEPELRENEGEIEAALKGELPKIIELKDIKGDLHCHSDWDGGENSIEQMAKSAIDAGYEYIGISDHTKFLRIEHGLNEKQLLDQHKEIEKLNSKFQIQNSKFRILHGCEANIMNDGNVDIKDDVLEKLDYVIAGAHSSLKMPKQEMTQRLIKAMRNPNIDIISHPTGRLIGKRDEYQLDFDKILEVAKETGTILEINSSPDRLDLRDLYIRRAKNQGIKMIINTDSHQKEQLNLMEYGVSMARRGWAEKSDIINTLPVEELLKYFK
ncbi:MAG: DNA polymerase III [Candidatus Staskawiczbacteria bacterium RIFOXYC1_FULL_37_43]|nr:MAG: DNA polymerase III [Candidatus Staskawiczbacteria bacterium RIFCSPHIGHO2_01_FULL_37_17]OGZ72445.1 MAG: DNA polymerase III [Candidatus Staskawiczbacteria bacterium RIFCSPLOWO2_01_FULL_37_19]OGZ75927.1 MAG: DNA polymerase III [Candidatus Staskawiczbacteria bacterium RIFOXYA1_FULL_37_15]OGZ76900.1 MAG: DNA polymerase III [Candidatus Staskawiczbacteria bacterium RIFOXYA12_FULL_37_10]OGZ80816.1 MAG: DNA polymerase III [Candidatus Staskawiczbacteria bacterium RIFOXYB1_FULL_38_37]OGZ82571.1 M